MPFKKRRERKNAIFQTQREGVKNSPRSVTHPSHSFPKVIGTVFKKRYKNSKRAKKRSVEVECKNKRTKFEAASPPIKIGGRGTWTRLQISREPKDSIRFGQSTDIQIDRYKQK